MLDAAGFWVSPRAEADIKASGVLPIALDTKRLCLNHRSARVGNLIKGVYHEPLRGDAGVACWGIFGGAVQSGLTPAASAIRECGEETGYDGPWIETQQAFLFVRGTFRYQNFLGIIPIEASLVFAPRPHSAWESEGIAWVSWHEIQERDSFRGVPLHDGLVLLLEHSRCQIETLVR